MCVLRNLEFMPQMYGSKCRNLFNQAITSLGKLENGFKKLKSTGLKLKEVEPISLSLQTFRK